ncbi:hypothetical protein [Collimonas antrihumi]|uniref:hypothetical protein n=1 Tax=Collimonas antrihumi TaxID=1940615 RepID=UPI001B8B8710|nr:hypothetical protein [Collimonas antrihumi]
MSDSRRRINKESANARPMLDFVQPQRRFGLRTPLVLMTVLLAGVFVFQAYQPWLQKEAGTVAHEWRIDRPLVENTNHAVVVATATEVITAEESNQDRLVAEDKADDPIVSNDLPAPDEVMAEIKPLPRQSQPQSATRRSPRVNAPAAGKSTNFASAALAVSPGRKILDTDIEVATGFVALPDMLAERRAPQQQIVIPEVIFSRHGRLMEVQMNSEDGVSK